MRFLFQAFWTEHLWPSTGAYAVLGRCGSCVLGAFLQDDGTSLREREQSWLELWPDRLVTTSWQAKKLLLCQNSQPPPTLKTTSSPPATGPKYSQLQCLHHCWPDQPGTDTRLARKKPSWVSALWWLKGTSVSAIGPASLLCVHAHVDTCTFVLIFKQHLSSLYINVWLLYTDNVSSPQGSSLHTGHMDNSIPVVELVIKKNKHTWPLSDSQGTRFLWTDVAANNTEEQLLPQTATGGRAHARPRRSRQTRPDKRRDRPLL